jgi:hypothetical protein
MAMTWQWWTTRSMRATAQEALGNTEGQALKAKLVAGVVESRIEAQRRLSIDALSIWRAMRTPTPAR